MTEEERKEETIKLLKYLLVQHYSKNWDNVDAKAIKKLLKEYAPEEVEKAKYEAVRKIINETMPEINSAFTSLHEEKKETTLNDYEGSPFRICKD